MSHIIAICHIPLQYVTYHFHMSHIASICHNKVTHRCNMSHIAAICHIFRQCVTYCCNMSYRSRYVKSGRNLALKNKKNVLDKRRPIQIYQSHLAQLLQTLNVGGPFWINSPNLESPSLTFTLFCISNSFQEFQPCSLKIKNLILSRSF